MTKFLNKFAADESGATAIEYGLIAALIAVALITVLQLVSKNLNTTFNSVADALTPAK
ncbi:MAG: Flp family type IVb pilin [Asticcacaulis sp.]